MQRSRSDPVRRPNIQSVSLSIRGKKEWSRGSILRNGSLGVFQKDTTLPDSEAHQISSKIGNENYTPRHNIGSTERQRETP